MRWREIRDGNRRQGFQGTLHRTEHAITPAGRAKARRNGGVGERGEHGKNTRGPSTTASRPDDDDPHPHRTQHAGRSDYRGKKPDKTRPHDGAIAPRRGGIHTREASIPRRLDRQWRPLRPPAGRSRSRCSLVTSGRAPHATPRHVRCGF